MIKYIVENFKTGYRLEFEDVRHAEREYRHMLNLAGVTEDTNHDIIMYHHITQELKGE